MVRDDHWHRASQLAHPAPTPVPACPAPVQWHPLKAAIAWGLLLPPLCASAGTRPLASPVLATDGGDQLATGLARSTQMPAKSLFVGLIVGRDRFGEVGHRIGHLLPLGLAGCWSVAAAA